MYVIIIVRQHAHRMHNAIGLYCLTVPCQCCI